MSAARASTGGRPWALYTNKIGCLLCSSLTHLGGSSAGLDAAGEPKDTTSSDMAGWLSRSADIVSTGLPKGAESKSEVRVSSQQQ